jgi:hypothetical protein
MLLWGKIYGKRNNKKWENVKNGGKMKGEMETNVTGINAKA